MLIRSDFHIHSEYSYDASNPLEMLAEETRAAGFCDGDFSEIADADLWG